MSDADLPMMPFFVKDWLAATMHWGSAERGAYISLLAFQWVNGKVPPDVSQLARISGLTEAEFEKVWLKIGRKFDGDESGLFNNRLEEHRKRSHQTAEGPCARRKRSERQASRSASRSA